MIASTQRVRWAATAAAAALGFIWVHADAAHTGPMGHACCDPNRDCIYESGDNCPGVYNPAQLDPDGDGRGNLCDNCSALENGPLAYEPGLSPVSQCDYDSDGYGNACDGDFDADGFVTGLDNPSYLAALMGFFAPFPGQHNMDCDGGMPGFATGTDNTWYLAQLMDFFVGPSGWACAGLGTGACPPLP